MPVPTVSVIITCFNYARYLPESVRSVVAQSYPDWELVIVDDGSTDDSAEVAAALIREHPESDIRLLRQENGGVSRARNAGIAQARGCFILPLDADDVLEPAMLEHTVAVLEARPEIAIAFTDLYAFGDGAVSEDLPLPDYDFDELLCTLGMFYCSLFRVDAWLATGGYDESFAGDEDWEFWIHCGKLGFVGQHVPRILVGIRNKEEGLHTLVAKENTMLNARVVAKHESLFKPVTVAWARAVLEHDNDRLRLRADQRVPDELLSRSGTFDRLLDNMLRMQETVRGQNVALHRQAMAIESLLPLARNEPPLNMLVLVVSSQRPDRVSELVKAWEETSSGIAELLVALDGDFEGYGETGATVLKGPKRGVTRTLNWWATLFAARCRVLGVLTDQHRPLTPGWDRALFETLDEPGVAIVYGADPSSGEPDPSAVAMRSSVITGMGCAVPPDLDPSEHGAFWRDLGRVSGCGKFRHDLVFDREGEAPPEPGTVFGRRDPLFAHLVTRVKAVLS